LTLFPQEQKGLKSDTEDILVLIAKIEKKIPPFLLEKNNPSDAMDVFLHKEIFRFNKLL
jgi:hypothetical protein